jgi:magnesium transporter
LVESIAAGVTAAAIVGMALPYLLRLLKRNPQLAAGPIALALADMITLLVYFNLARALLT